MNGRAILSIRRLRHICSCSERRPIFLVGRDRDDMFTFRYIKRILRIVPDAGGVRTSPNWTIQPPSCWPNVGTSFRTKSKCRFGSRFLCSSFCVLCRVFSPPLWYNAAFANPIGSSQNPATIIQIQPDNPKKPGSKTFERFDRYKAATPIGDATNKGANCQLEVQNEELQQEPPTEKQMRGAKCIPVPPWFPKF